LPDKQQLLGTLRAEYDRWQALLAGLEEIQLAARTLPADLSVKDVVGHLHAWQQVSIARLAAVLENREPVYPAWLEGREPDAEENLEWINARIHATYRDDPWHTVHAAWQAGFLRLLELASAIPERDLFDARRYGWLAGSAPADVLLGTHEHHVEHYEPLPGQLGGGR
jgi:hypothetical protein